MKNLIVSMESLPSEVKSHIENTYPHGYFHKTFEFEVPGKDIVYEALRTSYNGINYMIKLNSRKKKLDRGIDSY